jgi:hypothetical protein
MGRHGGGQFSRSGLKSGRAWPDLTSALGRAAPAAVTARPAGTPANAAALGRIHAEPCWSPADGDATLAGRPGQDTLRLLDVGLVRLVAAIALDDPGLSLHLDGDGAIRFVGRGGEPVAFSGALSIGNATLRFANLLRIVLG